MEVETNIAVNLGFIGGFGGLFVILLGATLGLRWVMYLGCAIILFGIIGGHFIAKSYAQHYRETADWQGNNKIDVKGK
jgi:hypothetical protein